MRWPGSTMQQPVVAAIGDQQVAGQRPAETLCRQRWRPHSRPLPRLLTAPGDLQHLAERGARPGVPPITSSRPRRPRPRRRTAAWAGRRPPRTLPSRSIAMTMDGAAVGADAPDHVDGAVRAVPAPACISGCGSVPIRRRLPSRREPVDGVAGRSRHAAAGDDETRSLRGHGRIADRVRQPCHRDGAAGPVAQHAVGGGAAR